MHSQVSDYGLQLDREAVNYVLEDTRLSTLQRKLVKETDESVAIAIGLHINECLLYPENASYVSRSSDLIQDAVMEAIRSQEHSWNVKVICGTALGRLGSLHTNYTSWITWVWKQIESASSKERLQTVFMAALEESIVKGGGNKEGVMKLLEMSKAKLEETTSELLMLALLAIMGATAKHWGHCFKTIFTEVVDIVVGWFMESVNMPDVRHKIGRAIIDWGVFWQGETEFAVEQVGYFMEDLVLETRVASEEENIELEDLGDNDEGSNKIEAFVYKWQSEACTREERGAASCQALGFLQMVDCVLSGIASGPGQPGLVIPLPRIGIWFEVIARLGQSLLQWRWREDVAMSWLNCLVTSYKLAQRNNVARLEERQGILMECVGTISLRGLRLTWVGQKLLFDTIQQLVSSPWLATDHVRPLVQIVLGERGLLPQAFMQTTNRAVQAASVGLIKELLQSKNVVILQDVYSLLCMRLEQATMALNNSKPFLSSNIWAGVRLSPGMASVLGLWVHACISKIATVSGSILSMWALEPSIFQLLASHSGMLCAKLVRAAPSLHANTVSLLLQHCATHSYFLSSSSLLNKDSTSPTAGNFARLLEVVTKLLTWTHLPIPTRQHVVKSIRGVLTGVKSAASVLSVTQEFQILLDSCVAVCYESPELCSDVMENLVIILDDYPLSVPSLISVTFMLLHIVRTGDRSVSSLARRLLAKIPPQITFSRERAKQLDTVRQAGNSAVVELALLDIFKIDFTADTLRSTDFKDFMLFISGEFKDSLKAESWRSNALEGVQDIPCLVTTSERLQTVWLTWAAAHFCVISKLKTPLGKAQETLGYIDQACRKLASVQTENLNTKQAQAILDFGIGLEKAMINGWDGSVAAMPAANKSTQLFFFTNKATCLDWLTRIRPSLIRIAFTAGQYSEAVRQAWWVLPGLVNRGELDSPASLGLLMVVCQALARLDAPHHLSGLYTWAKDKSGMKLKWIQAIIEIVRKQTETGVKSIKSLLSSASDPAGGNSILGLPEAAQILKPRLEELLYKGHESLSDHQTYLDWVKDYRECQKEEKESQNMQQGYVQAHDKYLIALSKFQEGVIPVTAETLEPGQFRSQGSVVQLMLEDLQVHLLQAGACLQNTFMRSSQSWNENEKLSKSLSGASSLVDQLLSTGCVTESEQRKILMFNMICQELIGIKERGNTMLARILKIEKGCSSSELLLIIKKWGEFFIKFRKNNPDFHYQLSNINLEIARVARKEKNYGLSESFLIKSLTGRYNMNMRLEEYVKTYDFFTPGSISNDRVIGLRQSGKVFAASADILDKELAVKTMCGLVLGVGQYQASQFNKQVCFLI